MNNVTKEAFRKMDRAVVKGIFADKGLNRLLQPFFIGKKEKEKFIK